MLKQGGKHSHQAEAAGDVDQCAGLVVRLELGAHTSKELAALKKLRGLTLCAR